MGQALGVWHSSESAKACTPQSLHVPIYPSSCLLARRSEGQCVCHKGLRATAVQDAVPAEYGNPLGWATKDVP